MVRFDILTIEIDMFKFRIRFFDNLVYFNTLFILPHDNYSKDENQVFFVEFF